MLTASGAKLLDFGLAKPAVALTSAATLTAARPATPVTEQGTIVGTFQYMSPEQIEGKELDGRSDIFSLGAVLYEMLTGKRAFEGKSQLSVASAIMERDPEPISIIRPTTPRVFDSVIRRCLGKDPEHRWQNARDMKLALELGVDESQGLVRAQSGSRLGWIVAALSTILAAAGLWLSWHRPETQARPLHFKIERPPGTEFVLGAGGGIAISPDGRALAFVAASSGSPKLWIRQLDSTAARDLPGTEGARFPFWSPDSRSIGFFANGKLQRIDLEGGPAAILATAPNPRGATWSSSGIIVFAPSASGGLLKVPAAGGQATPVTALDPAQGENSHRWPLFLPDGHRFLYLIRGDKPGIDGIYSGSVEGPQEKTRVLETSIAVAYSPARGEHPDTLYWVRQVSLMAQGFDREHVQLLGFPIPALGAQTVSLMPGYGRASVSVSDNGTIFLGNGSDHYQLTWCDRTGKTLSTIGQPDRYASLRISPDGGRIVTALADRSGNPDTWVMDLSHGIPNRLTFGGAFGTAAWSPDGQRIAYHVLNGTKLFVKSAGGAGQEEVLLQSQGTAYLNDWSPDGRYVVYTQLSLGWRPQACAFPKDTFQRIASASFTGRQVDLLYVG